MPRRRVKFCAAQISPTIRQQIVELPEPLVRPTNRRIEAFGIEALGKVKPELFQPVILMASLKRLRIFGSWRRPGAKQELKAQQLEVQLRLIRHFQQCRRRPFRQWAVIPGDLPDYVNGLYEEMAVFHERGNQPFRDGSPDTPSLRARSFPSQSRG